MKALAITIASLVLVGGALLYLMGTFRAPVSIELWSVPGGSVPLEHPSLQALTGSIASKGIPAGFWVDADAIYAARLAAIRQARSTIHFETYAMAPGRRAEEFAAALIERAEMGVRIRVLADAYGAKDVPNAFWQRLTSAGIEARRFREFSWRSPLQFNARTHRKLLLVDGRLALIGGAGVSDAWDGRDDGAPWRDVEFALRGPVVGHLEGMFLQNWLIEGGSVSVAELPPPPKPTAGEREVFVTSASPSLESSSMALLYHLNLESARRRAWIASPYFLPSGALIEAMVRAAHRGVDVKIVTPGVKTDKAAVRYAARELYAPLLDAGVKVYEYQPSMLHAKAMLVDGDAVTAGSSNFDARTFYRNDELTVTMRDPALGRELDAFFARTLSESRRVTPEAWAQRPLWHQIVGRPMLLVARQL